MERTVNWSALVPPFKWGAIVGAAMYVLGVGLALLENALTAHQSADVITHPVQLIPICLLYFALLFAFSAAGFYTGRDTGRAGLGAVAGMVTLVVQYVLGRLYTPSVSSAATSAPATRHNANPGLSLLAAVVAPLLFLGVAASLGWLGGRPGAQRHLRRLTDSGDVKVVEHRPPA